MFLYVCNSILDSERDGKYSEVPLGHKWQDQQFPMFSFYQSSIREALPVYQCYDHCGTLRTVYDYSTFAKRMI